MQPESGFNPGSIWRICNNKYGEKTHKGFYWQYLQNNSKEKTQETKKQKNKIFLSKPIKRTDKISGEIIEYLSLYSVKKDGFNFRNVSLCCHRKKKIS